MIQVRHLIKTSFSLSLSHLSSELVTLTKKSIRDTSKKLELGRDTGKKLVAKSNTQRSLTETVMLVTRCMGKMPG